MAMAMDDWLINLLKIRAFMKARQGGGCVWLHWRACLSANIIWYLSCTALDDTLTNHTPTISNTLIVPDQHYQLP